MQNLINKFQNKNYKEVLNMGNYIFIEYFGYEMDLNYDYSPDYEVE